MIHEWAPDDWELFSHGLLHARHGVLYVHKVPAAHQGDLGIDFYCLSGTVIYQCYAVEEPVDTKTRAERQQNKITTDLKKLIDGAAEVSKLMLGAPLKAWVLLVPHHNSKTVNLHCAKKTQDLRALGLPSLDPKFEVLIQDQTHFPGAALTDAMAGLAKLSLSIAHPTPAELTTWEAGSADLLANATAKLSKRVTGKAVQTAVAQGVEAFLHGNALIDALRSNAPDLHEKINAAIQLRVRTLAFAGPQGGTLPSSILNAELAALTHAIKTSAPSLSDANAQEIALGTVAEWIMRCPLDFPEHV